MIDEALISAEEFLRTKYDLPEAGRWTDLLGGRLVSLQPPDEKHGNVVLNLSKVMAAKCQASPQPSGMACFDTGVLVQESPDSILSPAMSVFAPEAAFAAVDAGYSEAVPMLVCEIASSNDRRRQMAERVTIYLERGIELVWVIDTFEERCHVHGQGQVPQQLESWQTLGGGDVIADFQLPVGNLFQDPNWWK